MTITHSILHSSNCHGFSAILCGQTKSPPPIYISTNPKHLNPLHLRDFFANCNYSCHRFPNLLPGGRVESVDVDKLRLALSNSSVIVSVFSEPDSVPHSLPEISNPADDGGDWLTKLMPVSPFNGRLVGFGRAVSDSGSTASIYDVMVLPTLQRRGIGRMILQRIIRFLTSRDVYDIAALCYDKERPFFKSCGFGDDVLESSTMMYTRTSSNLSESNQIVKSAGRKLLLVPPSVCIAGCIIDDLKSIVCDNYSRAWDFSDDSVGYDTVDLIKNSSHFS